MQARYFFPTILVLTAACLLSVPAQAEVYKWVDPDGVTRYGQTPPVGTQAKVVRPGISDSNAETKPGSGSSAPTDPPAEQADADAAERAGIKSDLDRKTAEKAQQRQQACEAARAELARVQDLPGPRLFRQNESGERVRMTEEEHQARLEKMRATVAKNCTDATGSNLNRSTTYP